MYPEQFKCFASVLRRRAFPYGILLIKQEWLLIFQRKSVSAKILAPYISKCVFPCFMAKTCHCCLAKAQNCEKVFRC